MKKRIDKARRIWAARIMGMIDQQCCVLGVFVIDADAGCAINTLIDREVDIDRLNRYFSAIRTKAAERGVGPFALLTINHSIGLIERHLGIPHSPDSAAALAELSTTAGPGNARSRSQEAVGA